MPKVVKSENTYFNQLDVLLGTAERFIDANTLKRDLLRGVKRLTEEAYSPRWGTTDNSLRFTLLCLKLLDTKVVKAEFRFSQVHWHTVILSTFSGHEIMLKGFSSGSVCTGSRAAFDILKFCGFRQSQCDNVWEKESFIVSRR
ncbi:hypothetical protein D3C71_1302250 [compost metagenome]